MTPEVYAPTEKIRENPLTTHLIKNPVYKNDGVRIPSEENRDSATGVLTTVSVCLATLKRHILYELGNFNPDFGYQRFVQDRRLDEYFKDKEKTLETFVFPSKNAALDCTKFVKDTLLKDTEFCHRYNLNKEYIDQKIIFSSKDLDHHKLFSISLATNSVPDNSQDYQGEGLEVVNKIAEAVKRYRQHTGRILSTTEIETSIEFFDDKKPKVEPVDPVAPISPVAPTEVKKNGLSKEDLVKLEEKIYESERESLAELLKVRLASFFKKGSIRSDDITVYPTGMAAIYAAYKAVKKVKPGEIIQLATPYFDTLEIQNKFKDKDSKTHYIQDIRGEGYLEQIEKLVKERTISAVFVEFPANPLLQCADLKKLSAILKAKNVLLVVDQTISTPYNTDFSDCADIIINSTTKNISGDANVMGGALAVNHKSPNWRELRIELDSNYINECCPADLRKLINNSADFQPRMKKINENAEIFFDWLLSNENPYRSYIEKIYYPKAEDQKENYNKSKRPDGGGYGALMSIDFSDELFATYFFNEVKVTKGPSLGTNFSLFGLFNVLAYFNNLPEAHFQGMPWYQIRCSIGLEPVDEMKKRFIDAAEKADKKAESHRKAVASIETDSKINLTEEQSYIQSWMEETAEKRAEYIRDAFNLALMGNDEYPD